jgi:GTP-binding protein EngB required for normal cell division
MTDIHEQIEGVPSTGSFLDCKDTSDLNQVDITVHDLEIHNILLLGESRSGKSTYTKLLQNLNYKTKMEVWRGTETPEETISLFNIDGKFIATRILDTPGFGEASKSGSRADNFLKNMIAQFVKKNITNLSLVLIVINGSGGLTQAQVNNITNCLKFLGKQVSPKTHLLVTHFENRSQEDEIKWAKEFKENEKMRFLTKACQGGFLFTGALSEEQFKSVKIRDEFISRQKRRNLEMFNKLVNGGEVSLLTQQMKQARSLFAVQESVTTSCMNIRTLIPEVHSTWNHAFNTRLKISELLNSGKLNENKDLQKIAEDAIEKLGILGDEGNDISKMALDDGVLNLMTNYEKIGTEIQERYVKILELLNRYSGLDQIASLAWDELEWDN